jgi:hypothetical protein
MEKIKNFLTELFKQKISNYVYLTYINYKTEQTKPDKYICFEYFVEDSREMIKNRIIEYLNIEEDVYDYKIFIKRRNYLMEYKSEGNLQLEMYDMIILESY